MLKGIIYIMTSAVPGLIKIGKTGSANFESRMYILEHDGYRNVTYLKRAFAIEVDDYDAKEKMLHTIFEKSRVSDTELFALDVNVAIQLLSSFDGTVVYPKSETKEEIFGEATDNSKSKLIPDGIYTLKRKKRSDNQAVNAIASVKSGNWTLKKDSVFGIAENVGISAKVKNRRTELPIDNNGILLEDVELGECSPSFVSTLVLNASSDGWADWKNKDGKPIDIYREKTSED